MKKAINEVIKHLEKAIEYLKRGEITKAYEHVDSAEQIFEEVLFDYLDEYYWGK